VAEYCKTSGVVLRIAEYSESSQIVTLWTKEFGKLQGIAKGARRRKGGGGAGMDLLNLCEIVFVKKPSPALNIITSWQVADDFSGLRSDLGRLYAAMYAAEFVSSATDEDDAEPGIFRLLVSFLRALAAGASSYPALLRFELLLLEAIGLGPHVDTCVVCGRPLDKSARADKAARFSPAAGGALCRNCAHGHGDAIAVSHDALSAMSLLSVRSRFAGSSQLNLSGGTALQVRLLLDKHIVYHLGRPLEMRKHVNPQGAPVPLGGTAAGMET